MRALADGDRAAFAEVFRVAKPLLVRYLGKLVADPSVRDELVQVSLLKVFEDAASYDPDRDAAAWIVTLASWELRSHRRDVARTRARHGGEVDARIASTAADPEREAQAAQIADAVRACVGELSSVDQEVLLAVMNDERRVGASFRKRVERALSRLKAKWSKRYGADIP